MNFKNMYKDNLNCEICKDEKETQELVMTCPRWERPGLDEDGGHGGVEIPPVCVLQLGVERNRKANLLVISETS